MGLLNGRIERRSINNPSASILEVWGGGAPGFTGKTINEENALSATAVWAAVRILSETIASLPLNLYKRRDGRGKDKITDNPLYYILHTQANPEMSAMTFRETFMRQLLCYGVGYANQERDGSNRVKALWPLLSANMEVKRANGAIYYLYEIPGGQKVPLNREDVLHIPAFSANGLVGESLKIFKEPIGLALALEEFGSRFFGNNAKPAAVLEHPTQLSDKASEHLRTSWERTSGGLSNAHRIAILEEGMKLHEYGVKPEEAQAIEARKFQIDEVARIFNVPPHLLKSLDRATFSNIEQQSLEFVIYCLRSWLVRLEQSYTIQLLPEADRQSMFFEHVVDGLLRGDWKSRMEAYAVGRQWGFLSANDVRDMENLNPIDGGDEYLVPLNMIPSSQAALQTQEPAPKSAATEPQRSAENLEIRAMPIGRDRVQRRFHGLIMDAATRLVSLERNAVKREAQKALGRRSIPGFTAWMNEFYAGLPDKVRSIMGPVLTAYMQAVRDEASGEIGLKPENAPDLTRFINDYLDGYTKRHIDSSLGQLRALVEENTEDAEAAGGAVDERVDQWGETRPEKIANNESVRAGNAAALALFFGTGFSVSWQVRGAKTCPYCRALQGKRISRGNSFLNSGDSYEPAGTTNGPMKIFTTVQHPPLHQGCDCFISAT